MTLMDGRYPAVYKKCLEWRGIRGGNVRPPQRELTSEEMDQLKLSLKRMGLL
jgi:dihydrodipicolinate synthase/N-acetylneuraminate lyase